MRESIERSAVTTRHASTENLPASGPLIARWCEGLAIVNLRCDSRDAATRGAPSGTRLVEAGPDDWFVIGAGDSARTMEEALRRALAGQHAAVTDVSSGYTVLRLSGAPVRDVLAQGCPLDLHPRAFAPEHCAGTHVFKASVWLWRTDDDGFELLVRRSFTGYVGLMLERCTRECGLVTAD